MALATITAGDFNVPVDLVKLTGCPAESFESYGTAQFNLIQRELRISPADSVFEIGCGVGRLAIPATRFLSAGSYLGLDIIKRSVDWCSDNISAHHSNFHFFSEDVCSPLHNPNGTKRPSDVIFPVPPKSIDRIILSSVFTHMLPDDVMHYLWQMHEVLKSDGLILTTMFLLSDRTLTKCAETSSSFSFPYSLAAYEHCRIQDPDVPEGAVAYFEEAYLLMLRASGFELKCPVRYGQWSGIGGPEADGQDYVIFGKASRH